MTRGRLILIAAGILALAGLAAYLLWPKAPPRLSGYVEGETLYFASPVAGAVRSLGVERGQRVTAGQSLFEIDPRTAEAQTAQAQAAANAGSSLRGAAFLQPVAPRATVAIRRADRGARRGARFMRGSTDATTAASSPSL